MSQRSLLITAAFSSLACAALGCNRPSAAPPAPASAPAAPAPTEPEPAVAVITAGSSLVEAVAMRPFHARYSRTGYQGAASKDLGPGEFILKERGGQLDVTISMTANGDAVRDHVVIDRRTLAPATRTFRMGDRDVALTYRGAKVEQVISRGEERDAITVDFAAAGFEANVLELVLAALPLRAGYRARIAWANLPARDQMWAELDVPRTEQLEAAGRTWTTWVCDVRNDDGSRKTYWIAKDPPYKIKMETRPAGAPSYWDWQLTSVE
ncbi:MAG: hypothetical protein R3B48_29970 [Kofleriaceae bacterium]